MITNIIQTIKYIINIKLFPKKITLYRGDKISFIQPDAFMEEYTRQYFMLFLEDDLGLIKYRKYKAGYIKWYKIPKIEHENGTNIELLNDFLNEEYNTKNVNYKIKIHYL